MSTQFIIRTYSDSPLSGGAAREAFINLVQGIINDDCSALYSGIIEATFSPQHMLTYYDHDKSIYVHMFYLMGKVDLIKIPLAYQIEGSYKVYGRAKD